MHNVSHNHILIALTMASEREHLKYTAFAMGNAVEDTQLSVGVVTRGPIAVSEMSIESHAPLGSSLGVEDLYQYTTFNALHSRGDLTYLRRAPFHISAATYDF